jgi:hypothetical protein
MERREKVIVFFGFVAYCLNNENECFRSVGGTTLRSDLDEVGEVEKLPSAFNSLLNREYLLNIYTDVSEDSTTLKTGAAVSSEMLSINQTTRCHFMNSNPVTTILISVLYKVSFPL